MPKLAAVLAAAPASAFALTACGDSPFISMRPKPAGAQPKLVIDGRHFNAHPAVVDLAFGDATSQSKTARTLVVTNPGTADLRLRLRLSIMPENVPTTRRTGVKEGEVFDGHGLSMDAPQTSNTSGFGNVGNLIHVVPPGGTLRLRMGFKPIASWPAGVPITGRYTGTHELFSNDPESPRVVFEMTGNAR